MNKFCDHIDKFLESNIETRDCVRKLDSDLSLKCSKSELLAQTLEFETKYISFEKYKELLKQIQNMDSKIIDCNKFILSTVGDCKDEINTVITDIINQQLNLKL